jgi:hypothetical protein
MSARRRGSRAIAVGGLAALALAMFSAHSARAKPSTYCVKPTKVSMCGATTGHVRTQWFYERQRIPIGQTREVHAQGINLTLAIGITEPGKRHLKHHRESLSCAASGVEVFWNTSESGMAETKSIAFSCTASCGKVTITPHLPWTSVLEEGERKWPLPDKWSGVRLGVRCGSTDHGVFEGSLTPHSGDPDDQGTEATKSKDEPDSYISFRPRSGELVSPAGDTLRIVGFYKYGSPKHEVVTGEL